MLCGFIYGEVLITHFMAAAGQWTKVVHCFIQIEKAPEASADLTCYVFFLEDAVAHLSVTDPSGILTIEK